jgi:hypothetical protein
MFRAKITLNDDFPFTEGLERIYLDEQKLRENTFTDAEISLLLNLRYFNTYENVPIVKKGIKKKVGILLDPICVALYDFYYGAKMALESNLNLEDRTQLITKMKLAKAIVRKYSPLKYKSIF